MSPGQSVAQADRGLRIGSKASIAGVIAVLSVIAVVFVVREDLSGECLLISTFAMTSLTHCTSFAAFESVTESLGTETYGNNRAFNPAAWGASTGNYNDQDAGFMQMEGDVGLGQGLSSSNDLLGDDTSYDMYSPAAQAQSNVYQATSHPVNPLIRTRQHIQQKLLEQLLTRIVCRIIRIQLHLHLHLMAW